MLPQVAVQTGAQANGKPPVIAYEGPRILDGQVASVLGDRTKVCDEFPHRQRAAFRSFFASPLNFWH